MTVATFPIAYPAGARFIEATFKPNRRQSAGVLASGRDIVIDRGAPQWSMSMKTPPLLESQVSQWEAWSAQLRGGSRFFLGWNPRREFPLAYMPAGWGAPVRADGTAFVGTVDLTSIGYSGLGGSGRDVITVGGSLPLPAGFPINSGDMISLVQNGKYSLHRVLDAGPILANASGVIAMWVEPEVPASFAAGVGVCTFHQSAAKFRLLSFDLPIAGAGRNRPGQATFTALSTLL